MRIKPNLLVFFNRNCLVPFILGSPKQSFHTLGSDAPGFSFLFNLADLLTEILHIGEPGLGATKSLSFFLCCSNDRKKDQHKNDK